MTDVRPFSPIPMDLALMRRLASHPVLMDTTTALTRGVNPLEAALLAIVPLADLGLPTLVLRQNDHGYIGQIRHRSGEKHAHLACLAPIPQESYVATTWLNLVDGLIVTAAKRGALTITAEVAENEIGVFKLLRRAGFMVYARQLLFERPPAAIDPNGALERVQIRIAHPNDVPQIQLLHMGLVPHLVQQADPMPEIGHHSLVIESLKENRLVGYLAMIEGKAGLMVKPYLHPDIFEEVRPIIRHALTFWQKAERLPLYFCVRSYQEWLHSSLMDLGFAAGERQAVFVKHTVARVEHGLEPAHKVLEPAFGTLVRTAEFITDDH